MNFNRLKSVKEDFNSPVMELYGNKRLIIFDCKSVIDYSPQSIVMDLGECKLKVEGTELVVDSFVFDKTDVKGNINAIEFI